MLRSKTFVLLCLLLLTGRVLAEEIASSDDHLNHYRIEAGDVLQVSVWGEDALKQEVLVLPDYSISFPLAGVLSVRGLTVAQLTEALTQKLDPFIPSANVHVSVRQVRGSRVYVLGKVNRPGEFPLDKGMNVLQALSMAGGMATFADENGIKVIRQQDGQSVALPFRYGQIAAGKALEQNIALISGDVVLVP
jgi:polysaccharide biosynthesis/export protein